MNIYILNILVHRFLNFRGIFVRDHNKEFDLCKSFRLYILFPSFNTDFYYYFLYEILIKK